MFLLMLWIYGCMCLFFCVIFSTLTLINILPVDHFKRINLHIAMLNTIGVVKVGRYYIFHRVFCFANIYYICKTNLIGQITKKPKYNSNCKYMLFWISFKQIYVFLFFHTKRTSQMDRSCKLSARCLKRMNPWRHGIVRVVRTTFIKVALRR